jgi:hypothetical protein
MVLGDDGRDSGKIQMLRDPCPRTRHSEALHLLRHMCARDFGRREPFVVKRDRIEQAMFPNVGHEPVELGALDQRQHVSERMKFFHHQPFIASLGRTP